MYKRQAQLNIICDKTLLSAAIDGVSKAVTLRSTIPVLEGILLKAEGFQLTLTGYDLAMGIVTTIAANVKEPGEVVLLSLIHIFRSQIRIIVSRSDEKGKRQKAPFQFSTGRGQLCAKLSGVYSLSLIHI